MVEVTLLFFLITLHEKLTEDVTFYKFRALIPTYFDIFS